MMDDYSSTKEAKIKYGEVLREQMRSDSQRKKLEKLENSQKPKLENIIGYNNNISQNKSMFYNNPSAYQHDIDKKELLQKQMEACDSFPFGKSGRNYQQTRSMQPTQSVSPSYQMIPQFVSPPSVLPATYQIIQPQQYYQPQPIGFSPVLGNYHIAPQVQQPSTYSPPKEPYQAYSPTKEPYGSYSPTKSDNQPVSSKMIQWPTGGQQMDTANRKRNLLKYENITHDQLAIKQMAKEKLQSDLKEQMNQVIRKKEEQKRKAEMENDWIDKQNQKYFEDIKVRESELINQKRKKDQAQKDLEQNQRQMIEKAQMDAMAAKKKSIPQTQNRQVTVVSLQPNVVMSPKNQYFKEQPGYRIQTRHMYQPERNYRHNTDVEQSMFQESIVLDLQRRNQTERKKREKYFEQVKKDVDNIRSEILNQSEMYRIEMEKVKMDAQKARLEKQKSEYDFMRLKDEYDKTWNNQKLKWALSKTDQYHEENLSKKSHNRRQQQSMNYKKPSRPEIYSNRIYSEPSQMDDMRSINGQSIKIPYDLSQSQDFIGTIEQTPQQHYKYSGFHAPHQQADSLDRLVKLQHINPHKWGSISSVDSSITHQIQRLLKQQRSPIQVDDQRHYSSVGKMSTVGKQSLIKNHYYRDLKYDQDEPNVNRINRHNERRLQRLKEAGIDQDGQLGRLDTLLDNY